MRTGTLTIEEFAVILRPLRRIALRAAFYWDEGHWTLAVADGHSGPSHSLPSWTRYRYRDFAFAAGYVRGDEIAKWLAEQAGKFRGFEFSVREPRNVNWRQKSSQPGYDLIPFDARTQSMGYMGQVALGTSKDRK